MSSPRRPRPADSRESLTATETRQVGGVRQEPELGDARTDDQRAGETDGTLAGGGARTETGREDHTTAERLTATDYLADDDHRAGRSEPDTDAQAARADAASINL